MTKGRKVGARSRDRQAAPAVGEKPRRRRIPSGADRKRKSESERDGGEATEPVQKRDRMIFHTVHKPALTPLAC